MRIALLAFLAIATDAFAGPGYCKYRSCERGRGTVGSSSSAPQPLFSWLTSSTTYDTSEELCDVVPVGKKTGNYWCQYGDGTMDPAGFTGVASSGTVSTLSRRHCPNGSDCTAKNGQLFNLGQYNLSNGGRSNDTDWTACTYVSVAESATYWALIGRDTTYGVNGQYLIYYNSGKVALYVYYPSGSVIETNYSESGILIDAPRFICGTFTSGAANTSVVKLYVDGVLVTTTSGQPTTSGLLTSSFDQVGSNSQTTAGRVRGLIYGSTYIPDDLTAGEIAAMTARMYASVLTADVGTSPVYTATSPTACAYSDANVTVVPTNGPCIRSSSAELWNAATNLFQYSTNLQLAPWVGASGGSYLPATVAAYASTSPSGNPSGTSITDALGSFYAGVQQTVTASTAAKYTMSCYLRGNAGGEYGRFRIAGTGNATGDVECTSPVLTTAWSRATCTSGAAYGGGLTAVTGTIAVGDTAAAGGTIYVWGCQLEEGAYQSPIIVSAGAAKTRAAPTLQSIAPYAVATTPALAADVTPGASGQYYTAVNVRDSGSSGALMHSVSAGNQMRYYCDNAGAAIPAILFAPGVQYHLRGYTVGSTNYCCQDATCDSVAGAGAAASYGTIDIGTGFSAFAAVSGLIKNVCVADSEALCP
jgi:hypothetical protein